MLELVYQLCQMCHNKARCNPKRKLRPEDCMGTLHLLIIFFRESTPSPQNKAYLLTKTRTLSRLKDETTVEH